MKKLKAKLTAAIESTELDPKQKQFMRSRWLAQVIWLEKAAKLSYAENFVLHFLAIAGGAIVTALASLNAIGGGDYSVRVATVIVGLIVTVVVALEGYFRFGEQWRHYRSSVEVLLSEGWEFLELAGKYEGSTSHAKSYNEFAGRVEDMIRSEVQGYFAQAAPRTPEQNSPRS